MELGKIILKNILISFYCYTFTHLCGCVYACVCVGVAEHLFRSVYNFQILPLYSHPCTITPFVVPILRVKRGVKLGRCLKERGLVLQLNRHNEIWIKGWYFVDSLLPKKESNLSNLSHLHVILLYINTVFTNCQSCYSKLICSKTRISTFIK